MRRGLVGPVPELPNQRGCSDYQQTAQVFVAHLADPAETFFPTARVLQRCQAEPRGELAAGPELSGICHGSGKGGCSDRTNSRNGRQATSHLVVLLQNQGISFDLSYLLIGGEGLPGQDLKHLHGMTGQVGHFFAFNDLSRQHQSPFETLRNVDAEFCELSPHHVHQLSSLLHQKGTRAVQGQYRLLLARVT